MNDEETKTIEVKTSILKEALDHVIQNQAKEFLMGFDAVHRHAGAEPHAFRVTAMIGDTMYDFRIKATINVKEEDVAGLQAKFADEYQIEEEQLKKEREEYYAEQKAKVNN